MSKSTYEWDHAVFDFSVVWLISLSIISSSFIHVVIYDNLSFFFIGLNSSPLYVYTTFSLSSNSWYQKLIITSTLLTAAAAKSLQSCLNSMWPHRRQPSRLPHPWDCPGKNTGVGCHFLLQCMKVKSESEIEVAQSCPTPRTHGLQPTRLLRPWDFPGKSTGVGCHCLLRSELWAFVKNLFLFQGNR